jgi:hypothetical protein
MTIVPEWVDIFYGSAFMHNVVLRRRHRFILGLGDVGAGSSGSS